MPILSPSQPGVSIPLPGCDSPAQPIPWQAAQHCHSGHPLAPAGLPRAEVAIATGRGSTTPRGRGTKAMQDAPSVPSPTLAQGSSPGSGSCSRHIRPGWQGTPGADTAAPGSFHIPLLPREQPPGDVAGDVSTGAGKGGGGRADPSCTLMTSPPSTFISFWRFPARRLGLERHFSSPSRLTGWEEGESQHSFTCCQTRTSPTSQTPLSHHCCPGQPAREAPSQWMQCCSLPALCRGKQRISVDRA